MFKFLLEMSIQKLRQVLVKKNFAAFIIPSEDAHYSEYVNPCDARRSYISQFTGSAGVAIITQTDAALWTDGRYFLQAENQLPKEFKLMKAGTPDCQSKEEWLKMNCKGVVAIDPETLPYSEYLELKKALEPLKLEFTSNLVDLVWENRPMRPSGPDYVVQRVDNTGVSSKSKLEVVVKELEAKKASAAVFGMLDDIAYLLNLRGKDVPFNPVFFSYFLVTKTSSHLFMDSTKLTESISSYLKDLKVQIHPYDSTKVLEMLKSIQGTILVDSKCNSKLANLPNVVIQDKSVAYLMKSIKSPQEQQGFRDCHLRDATALVKFFQWLFTSYSASNITEYDASVKLTKFRSQVQHYQGDSFDAIIGMKGNGAIIHYKPNESKSATIEDGCLLVDSGGQYLDGTTDITRTVWLGSSEPSQHLKECYTKVLQGHIAIDMCRFPIKTTGYQLDVLARQFLWKSNLNYQHGTGHGVGAFLCVHEGPHGIGFRKGFDNYALEAGMTVTNEPGYYEPNEFGIRIETILLVKQSQKNWLEFENVTVFPLERKLVVVELLSPSEKEWFNRYQQRCLNELTPLLQDQEQQWLKNYTGFV